MGGIVQKIVDCGSCNGSGKVEVVGYRDMKQKVSSFDKPIDRGVKAMVKKIPFKKIGKVVGIVAAVVSSLGGLGYGCVSCIIADNARAAANWKRSQHNAAVALYEERKDGVVFVEYANDGTPIKCIVQRDNTYTTTNRHRTMNIVDRHDDPMGNNGEINTKAKLLDWDESKQGRCVRFTYSFDAPVAP